MDRQGGTTSSQMLPSFHGQRSAKGQAVWFEQSEERFVPLALLTPPGEFGLHATGERNHWCVLPDPAAADKSVLLEYAMPPEGILELEEQAGRKPSPILRLDPKGGK